MPFLVQYRGPLVDHGDKVVAGTARLVRRLAWDDRLARHFACDCAERVMRATGWADARSWDAVRVARRYANGHATEAELDAAWAAARDAWAAAEGAAWAAGAAAWAAARAAAGAAAGVADGVAAGLLSRDLIDGKTFAQEQYDFLTGPWRKVIGPIHPDDADLREQVSE
mgnify:CR=1 FL=1